jgi:Domain of unknown function (DUF2017)
VGCFVGLPSDVLTLGLAELTDMFHHVLVANPADAHDEKPSYLSRGMSRTHMSGLLRPRRDGTFEWKLGPNERAVLARVAGDFRSLLAHETPSSDGSLQRVFPPAHPDDPIAELEYERTSGGALLETKLEQLQTFERCIQQKVLSEEDVLACMRAANDMRLVLGTRIDVREESTPADFAGDPETQSTFELYAYLSWLVESMIDALGEPA